MTSHGVPHFFAFPDSEDAGAVARRLRDTCPELRVVAHASGRPWLVGHWADEDFALARAGRDAVALIGTLPRGADGELDRRTARLDGRADRLAGLSRTLAGSFHVLGSLAGDLYAQGTAYGMRRIHHARVDGALVACDRAAELARLAGAEVDATALALRLPAPLAPSLPPRPMWTGLTEVAPGDYLHVPGGPGTARPRHSAWHRPPAADRTLAEGAAAVREALTAAVAARTHRPGPLSADLSGGLDSTSLCAVAAGQVGEGKLTVCSLPGDETVWDDAYYARKAAARWPHLTHFELPYDRTPLFYAGARDDDCRFDVPSLVAVSRARETALTVEMAARGSRLHMTGHGGDHLFFHTGGHLHDLVLSDPLKGWRAVRGYRVLFGWDWRPVLRQLADRRSYRSALAGIDLTSSGSLGLTTPGLAWLRRPVVQPWLTRDCLELAGEAVREAAASARPAARTIGRHLELSTLYSGTAEAAAIAEVNRRAGVPVTMPYFDDAVVDAALCVRPVERADPWQYKPVLKEAVRGILPEECRTRTTKVEGTEEAVGGLYRHRAEIGALWQDSALAKAGLVDAEQLTRLCETPGTPALKDGSLNSTIACETWLRAVA